MDMIPIVGSTLAGIVVSLVLDEYVFPKKERT
jgi:hypothetical protein